MTALPPADAVDLVATGAATQDRIIATSRTVAEAIRQAETLDPPLAEALKGKALLYSKTAWAIPVALVLAELARRYAPSLGLGQDTIALVAGLIVYGAALALRCVTAGRITSLRPPAPPENPATDSTLAKDTK